MIFLVDIWHLFFFCLLSSVVLRSARTFVVLHFRHSVGSYISGLLCFFLINKCLYFFIKFLEAELLSSFLLEKNIGLGCFMWERRGVDWWSNNSSL